MDSQQQAAPIAAAVHAADPDVRVLNAGMVRPAGDLIRDLTQPGPMSPDR